MTDETTPDPADELGRDSDVDVAESPTGLLRQNPGLTQIALVWVGGAVGVTARYGVTAVVPPWREVPVATIGVNLLGAFLLGALLEALLKGRGDAARRTQLRLLLGTGVLGGFTTFSALSLDMVMLLQRGHVGTAFGYGLGTVVIGAAATALGIALVAAVRHRRGTLP